jgi:hypothetical protein
MLAPEIDLGHDPSSASDVFSVGVMLWEALGRKTLHDPRGAAPPTIPSDKPWSAPLAELAARALVIDPTKRPTPNEMAAAIRMITRSKLATQKSVGNAVLEFASEHVVARRTRLARSSGRIPVSQIVTPFDADTSPRGRKTVPASDEIFAPEAATNPKPAVRAPSIPDEPTREISRQITREIEPPPIRLVEKLETGPHPIAETPPRPSLASTGEHIIPPPKERPVWVYALAVAGAIAAITIGLFVGIRPHDAVSPVVPVVGSNSPGVATSTAAAPPIASSARPNGTQSDPASSATTPKSSKEKQPTKAPLKRRDQYDPSSI